MTISPYVEVSSLLKGERDGCLAFKNHLNKGTQYSMSIKKERKFKLSGKTKKEGNDRKKGFRRESEKP